MLAVACSASVAAYEVSPQYEASYDPVFASVSAGGTVQLLPELAFGASASISTPLAETDTNHTGFSAGTSATYVYKMLESTRSCAWPSFSTRRCPPSVVASPCGSAAEAR